jgi:hypothetical protein
MHVLNAMLDTTQPHGETIARNGSPCRQKTAVRCACRPCSNGNLCSRGRPRLRFHRAPV